MSVTQDALAEVRGQAIQAEIEAAITTPPESAPVFEPSPALVELHATAKRLERNIARASMFSPRLRMRYDRARDAAAKAWVAEVAQFERLNRDTETPEAVTA